MVILNGKELSLKLYDKLEEFNLCNNKKNKLIILTIGNDEASKIYVKNKVKMCEKLGIEYEHIKINQNIESVEFIVFLKDLFEKNTFDYNFGVILQQPAPQHLIDIFNNVVTPNIDIDGFGVKNQGLLANGKEPFNYAATPKGIITLLKNYNIELEGKNVVIVGRSNIVGKPLAQMMLKENATITICHSKTKNLEEITKMADILVVAIGKANFIKSKHIKNGVTIVDVGINRTENGICGDVDFEDVKDKCYAITPVPGGVGPMTIYSLIENLITK